MMFAVTMRSKNVFRDRTKEIFSIILILQEKKLSFRCQVRYTNMGYRMNISVQVDGLQIWVGILAWIFSEGSSSNSDDQSGLRMTCEDWKKKGMSLGHPHRGKGEWASWKKERASEAGTWGQWEAVKGREELKEEGLYKSTEVQENNNRQIFGSYQWSQKKHWRKRRMSWGHISSIEELSADVIEPRDCSDFETRSPVKDNDRISSHTLKI